MNTGRGTEGYSLLEMLAVLAIFAMLAAAMFNAAVLRRPGETIHTVARSILHLVSSQSLRAIASGQTARVNVDIAGHKITADGSNLEISVPLQLKLTALTGAELLEQDEIGIIEFYSDGSSSGGEISLVNAAGASRAIRINWVSGAITSRDARGP
jgi:general secretion pathway protein H